MEFFSYKDNGSKGAYCHMLIPISWFILCLLCSNKAVLIYLPLHTILLADLSNHIRSIGTNRETLISLFPVPSTRSRIYHVSTLCQMKELGSVPYDLERDEVTK